MGNREMIDRMMNNDLELVDNILDRIDALKKLLVGSRYVKANKVLDSLKLEFRKDVLKKKRRGKTA